MRRHVRMPGRSWAAGPNRDRSATWLEPSGFLPDWLIAWPVARLWPAPLATLRVRRRRHAFGIGGGGALLPAHLERRERHLGVCGRNAAALLGAVINVGGHAGHC